jgi:metallo-beta-lactamase family protein
VEKQRELRVLGELVELRAQVEILNGYSAHADRTELTRWLDAVRKTSPHLRQVCLVHGEPPAQDALAEQLEAKGYVVSSPTPHSKVTV